MLDEIYGDIERILERFVFETFDDKLKHQIIVMLSSYLDTRVVKNFLPHVDGYITDYFVEHVDTTQRTMSFRIFLKVPRSLGVRIIHVALSKGKTLKPFHDLKRHKFIG